MRKRKVQAGVSIGAIMCVTVLFVLKVLAAPQREWKEQDTATRIMLADDVEVVAVEVSGTANEATADPPVVEQEIVEYVPDVSGIEETYISEEAYDACVKYGAEYEIAPELLMAMIERESQGNPKAYNGTDSGLMQVAYKWHYDRMERIGVTDLFDTDQNIHTGADFLAELYSSYGDTELVLMVYNMGYDTAYGYYSNGIISEYAREIVTRSDELQLLHTYGGRE